MGQQQLLLIVVGVIVVGISVATGIGMFSESAAQANFDSITGDALGIAASAQQWYMKPTSLGGGGRSFVGMTLTNIGADSANANGSYAIENLTAASFDIRAIGVEDGDSDGTNATVVMRVYADSLGSNPTVVSR